MENKKQYCNHRIYLANEEFVSPCEKDPNHLDDHEGWCLGSKASWPQDTPNRATLY